MAPHTPRRCDRCGRVVYPLTIRGGFILCAACQAPTTQSDAEIAAAYRARMTSYQTTTREPGS